MMTNSENFAMEISKNNKTQENTYRNKNQVIQPIDESPKQKRSMKFMQRLFVLVLMGLMLVGGLLAQDKQHTENSADQTLRSSGRVNPSTLGMEISIPLGAYPGRGINVPVSISYSSKVWRQEFIDTFPRTNNPNSCISVYHPKFSDNSASGWTSSLGVAYIEYTGMDNTFDDKGFPAGDGVCPANAPPVNQYGYIRRIQIHLPGGESHELRMNDTPKMYPTTAGATHADSPLNQNNWYGTYYAVDGSKMKYVETAGSRKLYLPDGSYYEFGTKTTLNYKTIRKATKYKDINNNELTFYAANGTYPNGYWKDTLNRNIPVPMPLETPTTTGIVNYNMPSFNNGTMTYKFHWKKLKGTTAADSGLTNFNQALKHLGDRDGPPPIGNQRTSTTALFHSGWANWAVSSSSTPLFNPIVLTAVELPDGRKYEFSYNIYGEIDKIKYPTGGEEEFTFDDVPAVGVFGYNQPNQEANRGVTQREVKENPSATPYTWTYSSNTAGSLLTRTINAPDGTKTETDLNKGNSPCTGCSNGTWGYQDALTGMSVETRTYASTNQIVSKSKTTWEKTEFIVSGGSEKADWHPRVTKVESIIYDLAGNAVSSSRTMTYAGNLNDRANSVDVNLTKEYGFTATLGALGPLQRQTEVTHLEYDTTISQSVRDTYKSKQLISLPSKTFIKNAINQVVAKSEIKYDEAGYSSTYRGNATRARTWLDTNNSWLETRAKYDTYGNVTETTDAKGNKTTTIYSATYSYAYPTSVTTPVPDPSGTQGSNTAFTTSTIYDLTTGLPTSTTDANGQVTQIQYNDVLLRPTKVIPPAGGAIVETIYGAGTSASTRYTRVRTQIDTVKWKEAYSYFDGLGRTTQTRTIDSNGDIYVDKEFDSAGRVKKVTNPYRTGQTKYWTENIYDTVGRVKEVILPDGAKVMTDYTVSETGAIGAKKTITDQAGKKRAGITDALGRMIRVIEDPTGQNLVTDYTFDTIGKLRKTTQGGQNRYFMYDSIGRLIRSKQPEQDVNTALNLADPVTGNSGWADAFTYDANGNILTTTNAKGISITATYDNFNRIKLRNYSDSTPDVTFYYDGRGIGAIPAYSKGKTTKVTSSVSTNEYRTFDNLGRLLTHRQITNGNTYNTAYTYNLSGDLIEETYPSGRKVKNTLDTNGDLSLVQTKTATGSYQNRASNISYLAHGGVASLQLGNNKWESFQYNNRQQITRVGLGTSATNTSLLKVDYNYGTSTTNNGSLKQQKISYTGYSGEIVQNYTYDNLNRIQSATETFGGGTQSWKEDFIYDRFGNRRFGTGTTTIAGCAVANCNPTISQTNNRFTSGQGYLYDKAGNITQDAGGQRFEFDAENHQTKFFKHTNATTTPDAIYHYDGDGKRVRKISGGKETIFVYNAGGSLIAEYETNITPVAANTKYLTQDHLGSPRIITSQTGAVISRHDYRAYGEEVYSGTANRTNTQGYGKADGIRKQYTGYERDYESGLDFAQARYYNSKLGRFTSVDPLTASANVKDPQTFNRYSYALNSPYKFTDPLGLIAEGANGQPKCDFNCRVKTGEMTKRDYELLKVHIRAGTAIGVWYVNNYQSSSRYTRQDDGTDSTVNRNWYIKRKDGTRINLSVNANKILNKGTQAIRDNIYKAMSAVESLQRNPQASSTISFSVSISGTGATVGPSGSITYSSTDGIIKALREANDEVKTAMIDALASETFATSVEGYKGRTLGETEDVSTRSTSLLLGLTLKKGSSFNVTFAEYARKRANVFARNRYNKNYPNREPRGTGIFNSDRSIGSNRRYPKLFEKDY